MITRNMEGLWQLSKSAYFRTLGTVSDTKKGSMYTNTTGYARLRTLVSCLVNASNELEQTIFSRWFKRRADAINSELEQLCADAQTRFFFDECATNFAYELEALLLEGPLEGSAQTAIDYLEGLFVQTQRFEMLVEPQPETEMDNNLAMAA